MRFNRFYSLTVGLALIAACSTSSTSGVTPEPPGAQASSTAATTSSAATSGGGGADAGDCTLYINTDVDAANCGACGVACATTCFFGKCQPVLPSPVALAENIEVAFQLALDTTTVYAGMNINDVSPTLPACGGKALVLAFDRSTHAASGFVPCLSPWYAPLSLLAMTVASGGVVWSIDNDMYLTALPGGDAVGLNDQSTSRQIAADSSYVFYGHDFDSPTLRRVNVDGTMATDLATAPHVVSDVAIDGQTIYYATQFIPGECCEHEIDIYSVPKTGGSATLLASGLKDTLGLSVGAGYVYWIDLVPEGNDDLARRVVRRVPVTGGQPELVVNEDQNPNFIALNGAYLYWLGLDVDPDLNGSTYTIWKQPLAGGESVELTAGTGRVSAFAVDDTSIVWARNDHENGPSSASIWMLAK
ncbi:MAG TPA: hypothetical protein VGM56_08830 [Byssovorax sp.]